MLKSFVLFAIFCAFICVPKCYAGSFITSAEFGNFQHINISIKQDSLAKKKIDSLTKALNAEKDKEKSILQKLVQPFKFKANRKAYVNTSIHDYIVADSIQTVKQLANLSTSVIRIQSGFVNLDNTTKAQLIDLQQKIKAVKVQLHVIDSIAQVTKPGGNAGTAPIDTPVKERNKAPLATNENTSQVPDPGDVKARQQKLNILRLLFTGPINIRDTSKKKDTVYIKSLTLAHKVQVLGYYADTSHEDLKSFNFKLINNFVFAINPFESSEYETALITNKYVIDSALKAKCNFTIAIYNNQPSSITALLTNTNAMNSLISRMLRIMADSRATGININFNGLDPHLNAYFVNFIARFYNACQARSKKYTLSITIPADDMGLAYDVNALNKYTTNFIIDFSKRPATPGPLEPLSNGSNNSITTCLGLYLDKGIDPAKFILGVSYSGVVWQSTPSSFMHYATYSWVRTNYPDAAIIYNKGESSARIIAPYKLNYLTIWYDDELTLGEKYDYALANKLGGVAIKSLGQDGLYTQLQDVLMTKLLTVDTATVGIIIRKQTFSTTLTTIIELLTKNPCGQDVPPLYSHYLMIINICFIVLLLVASGILYYNVKKYSESWIWRKQLIYILLGLFIVWTFFALMWLFFSSNFPYFGPSHKDNCVTIPFIILYLILVTGIGLGIFTWWLYRLNNEEDVP